MKRLIMFLCLGLSLQGLAQAPPLINYQGVVRRSNGFPIAGATLSIKFEILQNSNPVYVETRSNLTSNGLGLFNTQIGGGTVVSGSMAGINWGAGPYFLRVGIDTTNGTNYVAVGSPQQLVSVPYALHAASAPAPAVSFSNNVLSVGGNTVGISYTAGTITGSTNVTATSDANANYTLTVNPTLTVNNNSLSISGGNTVPMTSVSATGASTATATAYGYDINTPPVTITNGVNIFGSVQPIGILQISGAYPNFTIGAMPYLQYSSTTGSLTITSFPGSTPPYPNPIPGVYITPTVGLVGPTLNVGPTANQVDFTYLTPWRTSPSAPANVTLATVSNSVGIGALANPPTAKLHVDGYTRLGGTAPAVKMEKITGFTTAGTQGGSTSIPITGFTSGAKVLSVSVMVELTNGSGNWIPPGYVNSPGLLYTWQLTANSIDVYNVAGNSGSILGNNIRILVTYEQ